MRRAAFVVLMAVPMLGACGSPSGSTQADQAVETDADAPFEDAGGDASSDQDAAPNQDAASDQDAAPDQDAAQSRDDEPPSLIASSLSPRFANGDATVIVRVTANESLSTAEAEVEPAGPAFVVDATSDDRSYAWRYRVDGAAREGAEHIVTVALTDLAGNRTRVALEERFVVDRIAPEVADALIEPRRVQPGQSYTVSLETTELLGEAARVLAGDDELRCESVVGIDTERYECRVVVDASVTDGTRVVMAELVDRAGNTQTVSIGEVEYRSVPPTSSGENSIDLSRTIYTRVPWGADGMVLPRSSLRGRLLPGAAASEVVVANGPDLASAYVIGRAPIGADGAFEVPALANEGATDIYVATSDEAGAVTSFLRVTEGEWIATLRGKRVASSTENPHRAIHLPRRLSGLYSAPDDPSAVELGGRSLETRDYAPDAAPTAVRSNAQPRWRKREHDAPGLAFGASVYDAAHGKLMVFSGDFEQTWAWDGDTWTLEDACVPGFDCPEVSNSSSLGYDEGRGRVVLFGRLNTLPSMPADEVSHTWEWDGTRWRRMASCTDPSACPRSSSFGETHRMIYHPQLGRLVQIGGSEAEGGGRDLWQWEGDGWTRVPTTCAVAGACPATVGRLGAYDQARDRLVVYEGVDSSTGRGLTSELDGTRWSRIESTYGPAGRPEIGYDAERRSVRLFDRYDTSYSWNGSAWTSSYSSTCYPILDDHLIGYDAARSRMLLIQLRPDFIVDDNWVRSTWEWDGTTCTRVAASAGANVRPIDRELHSMFFDDVLGSVRMLAGIAHDGTSGSWIEQNDIWRWDGSAWSEVDPCSAESGCPVAGNRSQHAMAYDAQRNRLVVFGGTSDVSDTWEWDGQTWTRFESCVAWDHECPVARSGHALVYDAGDERVLLFGGRDFRDTGLRDTWEWRGIQWARVTPLLCDDDDCPGDRSGHAMAFDAERERVVLFGGSNDSAQSLADTWELEGNTWTRVAEGCASETSCPSARVGHTLTYDPARGRVVLFGGRSGGGAQTQMENDLWEWDGSGWTRVPITCAPDGNCPSARMFQTMAHDDARGQLVMFGGLHAFLPTRQALGDTWELATRQRPSLITRFDLAALAPTSRLAIDALDPVTIDEVRFVARAGARGDGGLAGAMLSAWDGLRWQSAACNSAPLDAPDELVWTTRDPKRIAGLQTDDELHFELTASVDSGQGTIASLNTDYVEVRVRYHLGTGPGAIAPEPGTGGQGQACDGE